MGGKPGPGSTMGGSGPGSMMGGSDPDAPGDPGGLDAERARSVPVLLRRLAEAVAGSAGAIGASPSGVMPSVIVWSRSGTTIRAKGA